MKIKAAVFDIDGTLVPYGAPGPGQAAVQALRELAQSGVAVVIATGRARYTAQWVLGSGIKPDYFAAVNGADVTDAAGRPVWQSRMTPEEMYALVDFCEDHELPLEFIFSDAYYVYVEYAAFVEKYCGQNAASGFFDSVLRDGEDQVRHLQDMPFGACAAMDARHAAAFEAKYGHLALRFIPFAPGRYDVLRAGAGKAAGVGRLLERLGISWAETAAFGDGENDAELLEAAGFAVAMEGGAAPGRRGGPRCGPGRRGGCRSGISAGVTRPRREEKKQGRTPAAGRCARPAQSGPARRGGRKNGVSARIRSGFPHTDRGNLAQPQKPGAGLFLRPSAESVLAAAGAASGSARAPKRAGEKGTHPHPWPGAVGHH